MSFQPLLLLKLDDDDADDEQHICSYFRLRLKKNTLIQPTD